MHNTYLNPEKCRYNKSVEGTPGYEPTSLPALRNKEIAQAFQYCQIFLLECIQSKIYSKLCFCCFLKISVWFIWILVFYGLDSTSVNFEMMMLMVMVMRVVLVLTMVMIMNVEF